MSTENFSQWVMAALKADDATQGVNDFCTNMWEKWKALYQSPGFLFNDPKRGGIFIVPSRTNYEINTGSGIIASYKAGLEKEDKYTRDIFNKKKLGVNKALASQENQEIVFFGYEAPLLRVKNERGGQFRISADLVALTDNGKVVIVETKLPGGDRMDKALLQAYGYAFFLACHLASPFNQEVIEHIHHSFEKVQGDSNTKAADKIQSDVHYMIVAPSQYFYENLAENEKAGALLEVLENNDLKYLENSPADCSLPKNPVFSGFLIVEDNHLSFDNFGSLEDYLSDVCRWHNFEKSLDYAEAERLAQIKCKQTWIFSKAARKKGEYFYKDKPYMVPYCLPLEHKSENLFEEIRDETYQFFESIGVSWHSKGENHLLSSQTYCVNFLFPFADKPEALKTLLQPLFPNIETMLPIEKGKYVTFEWAGVQNYLNEQGYNKPRGTYSTYSDAAVKFKTTKNETHIVLIEWKYTEKYNEASKAEGSEGRNRLNTYRGFCKFTDCPVDVKTILTKLGLNGELDIDAAMKVFFYEPFYQLFREQLLAHEIEKKNQDIKTVSLLHICPENNDAFHYNVTSPKLREMFPGKNVIEIWESLVDPKDRFQSTSPEALFQKFPQDKFPELKNWAEYMFSRYRLDKQV